jgi:hypothetical protein
LQSWGHQVRVGFLGLKPEGEGIAEIRVCEVRQEPRTSLILTCNPLTHGILVVQKLMQTLERWTLSFFVKLTLKTRGVSHCGLAIYIKRDLKAKNEEWWKLKYFTMQKYNLKKNPLKWNQNPSRYYNCITNLKFEHKPKYHLSKILI